MTPAGDGGLSQVMLDGGVAMPRIGYGVLRIPPATFEQVSLARHAPLGRELTEWYDVSRQLASAEAANAWGVRVGPTLGACPRCQSVACW